MYTKFVQSVECLWVFQRFPFHLFVILNFRASSRAKLVFFPFHFRIFHVPYTRSAVRNLSLCTTVHSWSTFCRSWKSFCFSLKSAIFAAQLIWLWAWVEPWVTLLHTHLEVLGPLDAIQCTLWFTTTSSHESYSYSLLLARRVLSVGSATTGFLEWRKPLSQHPQARIAKNHLDSRYGPLRGVFCMCVCACVAARAGVRCSRCCMKNCLTLSRAFGSLYNLVCNYFHYLLLVA